jgi:hypothetical protein
MRVSLNILVNLKMKHENKNEISKEGIVSIAAVILSR